MGRRRIHPGAGLPAASCGCARRPVRPPRCAAGRTGDLRAGLVRPDVPRQPSADHRRAAVAGYRRRIVMPATLSLLTAASRSPSATRPSASGPASRAPAAIVGFLGSGLLLHFFGVAVDLLGIHRRAALVLFVLHLHHPSSRDEDRHAGGLARRSAHRRRRRGIRVRRRRGAGPRLDRPAGGGCMIAGVALAAAFAVVELRRDASAARRTAVLRPDFATGAAGITLLFFANFGFFFVVMQYMQLILGYSPLQTASRWRPWRCRSSCLGATMHLIPAQGRAAAGGLRRSAADRPSGCSHAARCKPTRAYIGPAVAVPDHQLGIGLCTAPTTSAIMNAVPD